MEKWPDIFDEIISNVRAAVKHDSFGESVMNGITNDVKVENPQPYLNPVPTIPTPEVKI